MDIYSCANYDPETKEPIFWAFFLISDYKDYLEMLLPHCKGYELVKWIRPNQWALVKEVAWDEGKGTQEVSNELAFYREMGETIQWEKQSTPTLDYLEGPVDTNFYLDPNEAMLAWRTFVKQL